MEGAQFFLPFLCNNKKIKTKKHTKVHALNKQERREEGALVMKAVMAGKVSLVYCVLSVPLYK